jgi:hypothetical protein
MKIFLIDVDSGHFNWKATGRTAAEAMEALRVRYLAHRKAYVAGALWTWPEFVKNLEPVAHELELGKGYRDYT